MVAPIARGLHYSHHVFQAWGSKSAPHRTPLFLALLLTQYLIRRVAFFRDLEQIQAPRKNLSPEYIINGDFAQTDNEADIPDISTYPVPFEPDLVQ